MSEIETDRLRLRHLKVEDARDYHAIEVDPEVKQFLGGASKLSVQDYEVRIKGGGKGLNTSLAVTLKTTGQFLGRCGFTEYIENLEVVGWEINVVLGRHCPKKQGYATEIARALIAHGFDALACDRILGVADAANVASLKLCEKLGMMYDRDTIRYEREARIYEIKKHCLTRRSSQPGLAPSVPLSRFTSLGARQYMKPSIGN